MFENALLLTVNLLLVCACLCEIMPHHNNLLNNDFNSETFSRQNSITYLKIPLHNLYVCSMFVQPVVVEWN